MTNYEDDFIRIRNRPDQWQPDVEHRKLKRKLIGTYLFGLIKQYKYYYTDWSKE